MRTLTILFGIGLAILWLVGITNPTNSTAWLTWLDGLGAICAFILAGSLGGTRLGYNRGATVGGPIALAVGLFALWIIGMATNGMPWQNWWTFAFACGFVLVAGMGGSGRAVHAGSTSSTPVSDADRFRRSA